MSVNPVLTKLTKEKQGIYHIVKHGRLQMTEKPVLTELTKENREYIIS